ncbi:MAG: hypothetical protein NZ899_12685 [Thermoguttaceae bacterium]|nr:hypothetical protein [Thermoguttaceae bacterium]MDW8079957.1 hypothetical protein [Thermoguttaceae bacterium]
MSDQWYVRIGTEIRGPLTRAQVLGLLTQGLLSPEDALSRSPSGPWTLVKNVLPGAGAPAGDSPSAPTSPPAERTPLRPQSPQPPVAAPVPPPDSPPPPVPPQAGLTPTATATSFSKARHPVTSTPSGEHLSPAEIRREKRAKQFALVGVLCALLLGSLVSGAILVFAVYKIRSWLATSAQQPKEQRRSAQTGALQVPPVKAEQDLDELLAGVGSLLAEQPTGPTDQGQSTPRWLNASTETAQLGPFTIRVLKAEIGFGRLISPAGRAVRFRDPCLLVTLQYTVDTPGKQAAFRGWTQTARSGSLPILQDHAGRQLPLKRYGGFRLEGQAEPAELSPGESLTDVLAFEAPAGTVRSLRLVIPGEPFGAKGQVGFILPADMVADARPAGGTPQRLSTLRTSDRSTEDSPEDRDSAGRAAPVAAAKPGDSAAPVPSDQPDERIPIPGLEEEHAPQGEQAGQPPREFADDPKLQALGEETSRQLLRQRPASDSRRGR